MIQNTGSDYDFSKDFWISSYVINHKSSMYTLKIIVCLCTQGTSFNHKKMLGAYIWFPGVLEITLWHFRGALPTG